MLRWSVTVLLILAAGLVAAQSPSATDTSAANALPVLGDHDDDDHDDDCDNSGPGNCEDRGEDRDDDDIVPVTGEIPEGSLIIEIVDDDFFSPSNLTVDVGQSVTFVNRHDDVHTATGSGFDTGNIPPGGTATVVLDEPGTFAFACRYHPEMTGTIAVRGEDGTVPPPAESGPPPEDAIPIEIVDFAFAPVELTVEVGTTVAWTNADGVPHTVTAEDGTFDSDILDPGATFSFTFEEPGTYAYVCALHPEMRGTITVEAGAETGAPPPEEAAPDDEPAGDGQLPVAPTEPLSVEVLAGDCDNPGERVASLNNASAPDTGEAAGRVIPVAVSVTALADPIDALIAGDRVVVVRNGDGEPAACGALGGPVVAGEVVVGLSEVGESGLHGVVVLREERTGTTIEVYVTGFSAGEPSDEGTATPAEGVAVTMVDFAFDPATIEIPAGTTVTWTNEDGAPHTATADDGSFDTGRLNQGQSGSHTFDEPGTYPYHCDFHPDMTGTIEVVAAGT